MSGSGEAVEYGIGMREWSVNHVLRCVEEFLLVKFEVVCFIDLLR